VPVGLIIVMVILAVVVVLVAMIKPQWVKIQIGPPKAPLLSFEAGSGPRDSKEPGPRVDDDDEPQALASG
jgi:hypothetical protein